MARAFQTCLVIITTIVLFIMVHLHHGGGGGEKENPYSAGSSSRIDRRIEAVKGSISTASLFSVSNRSKGIEGEKEATAFLEMETKKSLAEESHTKQPDEEEGQKRKNLSQRNVVKMVPIPHLLCPPLLEGGEETDQSSVVPLIVFLHGAGESGSDPMELLTAKGATGTLPQLAEANPPDPFVSQAMLLSPQTDVGWASPRTLQLLQDLINETISNPAHRIDSKRIYLTGVSMGGNGALELAALFPEMFAAVAPLCGFGDANTLCSKLVNTPLYFGHGANDAVVSVEASDAIVKQCKSISKSDVIYNRIEKASDPVGHPFATGHAVWRDVYSDQRFWKWLYAQKRN